MSDTELVGTVVLGHYRIVRPLATGGMGAIYLARNEGAAGFVRPVVVKRILADRVGDESFVKMFVREARILSQLHHPSIVGILDFTEERGSYFMVLEYVHGYTLRQWSRFVAQTGRVFPADAALEVAISVAEALHYAHTLPGEDGQPLHIVHRDVSPGNVLVDLEGHVKLADFGIARTQRDRTDVSPGKELKGKIAYMAPELLKLEDPAPASDQYSCAVVLHELLTGRNEFYKGDPANTAMTVLAHELSPVHQSRTELPAVLSRVIARATARDPGDRYDSSQELADALRAVRAELPTIRPLAELTAVDFQDPKFADLLGVQPLDDLARAWRAGVAVPPVSVPTAKSEAPTIVVASAPAPRRGLWLGLAALLVAGGGTAVILTRGQSGSPTTRFVLIDGQATPYGEGAPAERPPGPVPVPIPATPSPAADAGAAAPPAPTPGKAPPDKAPRPGVTDELGRAFAGRRGLVARCVEQHASGVQGAPEVVIRFHVGTDGQVTAAELSPPALQGTPVGSCILDVARATRFPAQAAPVSFRIPVSFRQRR